MGDVSHPFLVPNCSRFEVEIDLTTNQNLYPRIYSGLLYTKIILVRPSGRRRELFNDGRLNFTKIKILYYRTDIQMSLFYNTLKQLFVSPAVQQGMLSSLFHNFVYICWISSPIITCLTPLITTHISVIFASLI